MSKETAIKQEILKLSIEIASLRYDYEQAVKQGLPYSFIIIITQKLCEKNRIKNLTREYFKKKWYRTVFSSSTRFIRSCNNKSRWS